MAAARRSTRPARTCSRPRLNMLWRRKHGRELHRQDAERHRPAARWAAHNLEALHEEEVGLRGTFNLARAAFASVRPTPACARSRRPEGAIGQGPRCVPGGGRGPGRQGDPGPHRPRQAAARPASEVPGHARRPGRARQRLRGDAAVLEEHLQDAGPGRRRCGSGRQVRAERASPGPRPERTGGGDPQAERERLGSHGRDADRPQGGPGAVRAPQGRRPSSAGRPDAAGDAAANSGGDPATPPVGGEGGPCRGPRRWKSFRPAPRSCR